MITSVITDVNDRSDHMHDHNMMHFEKGQITFCFVSWSDLTSIAMKG